MRVDKLLPRVWVEVWSTNRDIEIPAKRTNDEEDRRRRCFLFFFFYTHARHTPHSIRKSRCWASFVYEIELKTEQVKRKYTVLIRY